MLLFCTGIESGSDKAEDDNKPTSHGCKGVLDQFRHWKAFNLGLTRGRLFSMSFGIEILYSCLSEPTLALLNPNFRPPVPGQLAKGSRDPLLGLCKLMSGGTTTGWGRMGREHRFSLEPGPTLD